MAAPVLTTIRYEVADDHVATITLDRPEVLNAFNRQMGLEFEAIWREIRDDADVHAVVLRAAGDRAFCSDDATFFDPHVTYGMTAAMEPIGLTHRIPLGDVLRMTLLGLDERMSPERALAIGLVTEITAPEVLWERAHELAARIAAKPPAAVQGSVRAIWESLDLPRTQALARGSMYCELGNPVGTAQVDQDQTRPDWTIR